MPKFELTFSTIFDDDGFWVETKQPYTRVVFADNLDMAQKMAEAMGVDKEVKRVAEEVGVREYLFELQSIEKTDKELSNYWPGLVELVWENVLKRMNLKSSQVVFKDNNLRQKSGFSLKCD